MVLNSHGEKSGRKIGMKLNTAQIDVEIEGYQYESNINNIHKSTFQRKPNPKIKI